MAYVYIQAEENGHRPHHFDAACAYYGALDNNYLVKLLSYDELLTGKFDKFIKTNLFVGTVEFMNEVFRRGNITPDRLPNSDRTPQITTIQEVVERINSGEELFVKPVSIKLFTGMVFKREYLSLLNKLPQETQVMVEKPFESPIVSEWRMYVDKGKIRYIGNYSGDIFTYPHISLRIEEHIQEMSEKFISFTCDVAILKNGHIEIVEYNDMWAIGNYGMPNDEYLNSLKKRYFQIVMNNK